MKKPPETVPDYIKAFPPATRRRLAELRLLILAEVPGGLEKISYAMPAVHLKRILVHYAGYDHHIGFYPGAATMKAFEGDLRPYKTGKGSVQFPLDKPLPKTLVRKMVRHRLQMEAARP